MSSELLHSILITGMYSQLNTISGMITPKMNLHTLAINTREVACKLSHSEEARETHILQIQFEYHVPQKLYTAGFLILDDILLQQRGSSIKDAFDKVVTEFGFGAFIHLIPK
jgi:hypothetical protein